jgi:hypothetical protein
MDTIERTVLPLADFDTALAIGGSSIITAEFSEFSTTGRSSQAA